MREGFGCFAVSLGQTSPHFCIIHPDICSYLLWGGTACKTVPVPLLECAVHLRVALLQLEGAGEGHGAFEVVGGPGGGGGRSQNGAGGAMGPLLGEVAGLRKFKKAGGYGT